MGNSCLISHLKMKKLNLGIGGKIIYPKISPSPTLVKAKENLGVDYFRITLLC